MLLPTLAYVETSLPAADRPARFALARTLDLALEIADDGGPLPEPGASDPPLVTLQAWRLHEDHPLHPEPERRARARRHVREAIERAAERGIPRVLVACGFGERACEDPFQSCLETFAPAVELARDRGVRLLLEPLSPLRAPALTDADELARLIDALDAPDVVATAVDVGHLADGGHDPCRWLVEWPHPVEELQLRGPRSTPPPPDLPVGALLDALPAPPAVVCVEHREPLERDALAALVARIRRAL